MVQKSIFGPAIAAAALLAVLTPAQAQLAPQWNYCKGEPGIDWRTQIENCTQLIESGRETRRNRSVAFINRGLAYYYLGQNERAISDYSEALYDDPNSSIAYHNRALVYRRLDRQQDAIADATQALRLNPRYASAHVIRGNAYQALRDYDRALAEYNASIRIAPDYLGYYNRGLTHHDKGNYAQAIADFDATLRLKPGYVDAIAAAASRTTKARITTRHSRTITKR